MIRLVLRDYWIAPVSSYISIENIGLALDEFGKIISSVLVDFRYSMLWLTWLFCWLYTGFGFIKRLVNKENNFYNTMEILFLGFLFIAPFVTLLGVLLTGNYLTRYLLPLPVYSAVGASFLLMTRYSVTVKKLIPLGLCFFAVVFVNNYYDKSILVKTKLERDFTCFDRVANDERKNFVGSFWTIRNLDLYRSSEYRVFQILDNIKQYNWLSNRYNFEEYPVNGVIVDKAINPAHINSEDVKFLGDPNRIVYCEGFDLYIFDDGTSGFIELNSKLREK